MKAVTLKKIKDELQHCSTHELIDLCLQLSKHKKENKELLTYLLFESENEDRYIEGIKEQLNPLFEDINTKSFFYIRKSMRKILSLIKKYIRYSKKKETEIILLVYYCQKLKDFRPSIQKSPRLQSIFDRQIVLIQKALATLHEDLQFEYQYELDALLEKN